MLMLNTKNLKIVLLEIFSHLILVFESNIVLCIYARKYDVVFGISIIYMLIWKKIIPTKTKFVIFNSVFVRMLNVYSSTSWQFKVLVWILKDADGIVFLSQADMKKVADSIPSIADKLYFVDIGG